MLSYGILDFEMDFTKKNTFRTKKNDNVCNMNGW